MQREDREAELQAQMEHENAVLPWGRIFGEDDGEEALQQLRDRVAVLPDPAVDTDAAAWCYLGMLQIQRWIEGRVAAGREVIERRSR